MGLFKRENRNYQKKKRWQPQEIGDIYMNIDNETWIPGNKI